MQFMSRDVGYDIMFMANRLKICRKFWLSAWFQKKILTSSKKIVFVSKTMRYLISRYFKITLNLFQTFVNAN